MTRDEQIRLIAYQLWEEEGRPQGRHLEHWVRAERRWAQTSRLAGTGAQAAALTAPTTARPSAALATGAAAPETATAARRPARAAAKQAPAGEQGKGRARPPRKRRQDK